MSSTRAACAHAAGALQPHIRAFVERGHIHDLPRVHKRETIAIADPVIDLGPGAGGEVVSRGLPWRPGFAERWLRSQLRRAGIPWLGEATAL